MTTHIVNEGMTDAAASAETSAALAAGETFHGYLDGSGDRDWIRVELAAGASYMIAVSPRDPDGGADALKASPDTVLEILNADGAVVAMKDDLSVADMTRHPGAAASHPIVTFAPEAAGVYYLSVSSYARTAAVDNSGGYALKLTEMAAPADPDRDLTLTGTAGADKLVSAGGEDTLSGGAGDDFLSGGGANDELFGEAGDDTLEGGPGEDTLNGGASGSAGDTVSYANSAEAVRVNLGKATASGGEAEGDEIMQVENIIGSAGDDWLRGDAGDNRLTGGAGDDTLIGGGGGNDRLMGGMGDDTLNGGEGNDMLTGGMGADLLTGGPGGDTISYEGSDAAVDIRLRTGHASGGHAEGDVFSAVENVIGSAHNDRLAGDNRPAGETTGGNNKLEGRGGDDELYGGSGDDTLEGGMGDDALFGGAGADTLDGGAGDDTLTGGMGGDRIIGGAGEDTVSYANATDEKINVYLDWDTSQAAADASNPSHSDGDYFPNGDVENVEGSPRGDIIQGNDQTNKIWGGAGADRLIGHGGDDILDGGPGGDILDGDADGDGLGNSFHSPPFGVGFFIFGTPGASDTATYENSDAGVRVTASSTGTPSTGNEGGDAEGDRLLNIENLIGSDYDDRLFGDAAANELSGGAGADKLVGHGGNDAIEGGPGSDTLDGDDGEYSATHADVDVLSYASSTGGVTVDLSRQYLVAGTTEQQRGHYATGSGGDAAGDKFRGFEQVTGGMGNDRLTGDGWNNYLIGGPGADVLHGGVPQVTGAGADGQFGTDDDVKTPADFDIVSYADSKAGVTITFTVRRSNNEDVTVGMGLGGDAAGDRLLSIEQVIGSAHNDTFIASNIVQVFHGGVNAMDDPATPEVDESKDVDTLSYANLSAPGVTIELAAIENYIGLPQGDDVVTGTAEANRLETGGGEDTLNGLGGPDTLLGGAGADTLNGGDGNDLLVGGGGADTITGGGHVHAIDGQDGRPDEAIEGAIVAFVQEMTAPGTVDVSDPSRGYDGDTISYAGSNVGVTATLSGVSINLSGPDGFGSVRGDNYSPGSPTPQSSSGGHAAGETIAGDIENIIGSDRNDNLRGNGGGNAITGGKGDDYLRGNGEPSLNSGARDRFGDVFIFAPGDGVDVIADFDLLPGPRAPTLSRPPVRIHSAEDRIDVRAFNFDVEGVTTLAQLAERNEGFSVSVMDLDGDEQGTDGKDDTLVSLPGGGQIHLIDRVGLEFDHFVFELV